MTAPGAAAADGREQRTAGDPYLIEPPLRLEHSNTGQLMIRREGFPDVAKVCQGYGDARASYGNLFAAAPGLFNALSEAGDFSWVHNAAITDDVEALRRICLAYSRWWNGVALPALEKARGG